jgi:hypothetical protein
MIDPWFDACEAPFDDWRLVLHNHAQADFLHLFPMVAWTVSSVHRRVHIPKKNYERRRSFSSVRILFGTAVCARDKEGEPLTATILINISLPFRRVSF